MKRKIWTVLLTMLLALCVPLGLAACDLFGGDAGESGDNGDDTTIVTPGDPDEEPVTPHEHTYTSAVTKEPTCTQEGEMTYTCTCGDSYTEPIAMIPHNYVDGVCTMCGTPEPQPTEGLVFTLSDDGTQYSVTDYKGAETEVTITATYKGLPVTGIGWGAFAYCGNLTSVTIGNGVTSIGDYAFQSCSSLTSIEIPDSVTSIGEAFTGTAYYNNESNWENDVLYIGNHLIKARTTLSDKYIIKQGTKTIADSAFEECCSLTSIEIPDSVIGIGDHAFSGCSSLTSIVIPNSVASIGWGAFAYCGNLTSVTIGNGVTSIGAGVFEFCSGLENITVTSGNPVYHSAGNCLIETERKTLVVGCKNSIIPTDGSVTSIGHFAFEDCSSLTSITIPSGVTSIGQGAFYDCSSLTSITIPDSVTSIGNGAFASCSCLTSITLPDSITCIVDAAFHNTAYYNDESNWENDVLYIGNHLINARDNLSGDYIIRQGTKTIADSAFWYCRSLTSISIPDSVTSIGVSAFRNCTSLTSITIPDSVTSIGKSVFYNCRSLTSVTFEDPEGWYRTSREGAASGTDLASSALSNPATAAKYLRLTYDDYYWYKR